MFKKPAFVIPLLVFLLCSCNNTPIPRPRGFFRIELPPSEFIETDYEIPYSFTYPQYAVPEVLVKNSHNNGWINLTFPQFNGILYLSYKTVDNNNLATLINDAHDMAMKHIPKSTGIDEKKYIFPDSKVYGTGYFIKGSEAASAYQFFVTDSTTHFLRGALYFNVIPNNDSLAPVITFLTSDIEKIIESIRWK